MTCPHCCQVATAARFSPAYHSAEADKLCQPKEVEHVDCKMDPLPTNEGNCGICDYGRYRILHTTRMTQANTTHPIQPTVLNKDDVDNPT